MNLHLTSNSLPFRFRYTLKEIGERVSVREKGWKGLHLLSAPSPIRFAHVLRRFDGGDEFEDDVGYADDADYGPEDDVHGVVLEEDGAAEDVDF